MIHIALADDHELVRMAIREFLHTSEDIVVVAEASSGTEILELLQKKTVDLLSLDMQMPGISGTELIQCIRSNHPDLPILILSAYQDPAFVLQALKAGASGYVSKNCTPGMLLEAIRKMHSTGKFLSPDLAQKLAFIPLTTCSDDISNILSEREIEVFERIVAGKSIKQISFELFISDKTVSTHKAHLLEKLGLKSVPDLVKYAIQRNLFD